MSPIVDEFWLNVAIVCSDVRLEEQNAYNITTNIKVKIVFQNVLTLLKTNKF